MSPREVKLRATRGPATPAGRPEGPRRACHSAPGLRNFQVLLWIVFIILTPVSAESALVNHRDRHWKKCKPGFHVDKGTGKCVPCTHGEDFRDKWNSMFSCIPCRVCKSDEEEISPCTPTENTQCRCKRGTFRDENSPEMCQKCSTGCPGGKVQVSPCTFSHDLNCTTKEAVTNATGEVTVSGELMITSLKTSTAACPSSSFGNLATGNIVGIVLAVGVLVVVLACVLLWRCILPDFPVISKLKNRVSNWRLCPRKCPGADDNAHNEALSNRESQARLDGEMEGGSTELAGVTGAMVQMPVDAQPLLEHPNAEGSRLGRMLLVPVSVKDASQTLRSFFNYFIKEVPFLSWNAVMREMGLTDNEIHVATARAVSPEEVPYNLLVRWHQKTGHSASVNTLLEALETVGERKTRETIQAHLVDSGRYIYQEYEADSCC